MRIAVASGKGGTGKTTVAVNLAYFNGVEIFDLDVEEPNAHVFLKGEEKIRNAYRKVPEVKDNCTGCGKCKEVCKFSAIYVIDKAYPLHELCHSCGACAYFCPENAIEEVDRLTGKIVEVDSNPKLTYGVLEVGEASPVFLIKKVKELMGKTAIIDSPPGVACPMVESVRDSDFVILVAEPSPFSLHDLRLAISVVEDLKIKFGVVINKHGLPFRIENYCREDGIEIIGKIPFKREIAEKYSHGELLFEYSSLFRDIYSVIS
ncbi:MAG TPA: [Fe-S]-binding protein [Archaeoglobus sp.]|nr:[Fe-S]-binding protein [Archaeoglobus sp.]